MDDFMLIYCRRFVWLCNEFFNTEHPIEKRVDYAIQLVALHRYLNTQFCHEYQEYELEQYCRTLITQGASQ